jgi:uncharacterized protein (DUF433 family)
MAEPSGLSELLEEPMYTSAMAARLTKLSATRVRRWLKGYRFSYEARGGETRRVQMRPVVERPVEKDSYASFLDLIDILFVKQFVDHGVSLQRVRKALEEAQELLGGYHFAQRTFFTSGKSIYLQIRDEADALLELLSGGQWVIAPFVKELATQVDFHDTSGLAERWYPMGRNGLIVLDPRVSFGTPTIVDRGVETANVFDLYAAESENVDAVSWWMKLRPEEVRAAVEYEQKLHAA